MPLPRPLLVIRVYRMDQAENLPPAMPIPPRAGGDPHPETGVPRESGFYEIESLETGARRLLWVRVSIDGGASFRARSSRESVPVTDDFLKRHMLTGPIRVPDELAAED